MVRISSFLFIINKNIYCVFKLTDEFCRFFFIFMLRYYKHFTNAMRRRVYMACKKETVPFSGTPEQEAALKKVIAELKDTKGALMPIMQQAQDIYGYLPIEVQTMISDETGIPLEKIYGVSTFYSQFALQPKGKYQISVCLGTACYVKGSGAIFSKLEELLGITNGECTPDGRFSLDSCRCVGACGLAPVMMINDEVYGRLTPDDIPGILAKYN